MLACRPLPLLIPLPLHQQRSQFRETPRWKIEFPLPKWFEALHHLITPQSLSSTRPSSSVKRRQSPDSGEVCKRCLCPGHNVGDCRHQLTCRRCSGIGHFDVCCPLGTPPQASSSFKKVLPSTKKHSFTKDNPLKPLFHVPVHPSSSSFRVSLPISEAIIQSKEDLKRMIVIKVISGNASVKSLHDSLPQHLKTNQCEHITPYGDDFIITLFTAKVAAAIVKKSPISLQTNLGQYSLKLAH